MIIKWRNKLNTNCLSCPNSTVVKWQGWDRNLETLLSVPVFITTWNYHLVYKGGRTLAGPWYSRLGPHWLPLSFHYQTYNPIQYSFLGNSADREAWWATVHGVAKSQTWLSDWVHTHQTCHRFLSDHTLLILLNLGTQAHIICLLPKPVWNWSLNGH